LKNSKTTYLGYPQTKSWKNFTTAEGGASTWLPLEGISNNEIYKMYQLLSLHGQNKDALAKTKIGAWEYDIINSLHLLDVDYNKVSAYGHFGKASLPWES
jgi:hypothetical protein